jgi:hypothetical protein
MKKINSVIFLLAMLMVFIFSSCISIERAIKINEDGSGSEVLTIHYGKEFFDIMKSTALAFDSVKGSSMMDSLLSEDLFANEMKGKYKKMEGITLKDIKAKYNSDSSMNIKVSYKFDNIKRLEQSLQTLGDEGETFGTGKTEIVYKKDANKILFSYKYELGSVNDTNKSIRNSMSAFFKDQKMTFNISFPYKIKNSNATKTNGKTLTWIFEMDKMMTEGIAVDLEAEMKK